MTEIIFYERFRHMQTRASHIDNRCLPNTYNLRLTRCGIYRNQIEQMSIYKAVVTETGINIAATTDDNYAVNELLGQLALCIANLLSIHFELR